LQKYIKGIKELLEGGFIKNCETKEQQ